eukprot:4797411-Pyramimonas_sp.AAC.1
MGALFWAARRAGAMTLFSNLVEWAKIVAPRHMEYRGLTLIRHCTHTPFRAALLQVEVLHGKVELISSDSGNIEKDYQSLQHPNSAVARTYIGWTSDGHRRTRFDRKNQTLRSCCSAGPPPGD